MPKESLNALVMSNWQKQNEDKCTRHRYTYSSCCLITSYLSCIQNPSQPLLLSDRWPPCCAWSTLTLLAGCLPFCSCCNPSAVQLLWECVSHFCFFAFIHYTHLPAFIRPVYSRVSSLMPILLLHYSSYSTCIKINMALDLKSLQIHQHGI